eukprot:6460445-Lingulodinium_polyedra.AAC.2
MFLCTLRASSRSCPPVYAFCRARPLVRAPRNVRRAWEHGSAMCSVWGDALCLRGGSSLTRLSIGCGALGAWACARAGPVGFAERRRQLV